MFRVTVLNYKTSNSGMIRDVSTLLLTTPQEVQYWLAFHIGSASNLHVPLQVHYYL